MKEIYTVQLPQETRDLLESLSSEISGLKQRIEEMEILMAISEADFTLLKNRVADVETVVTDLISLVDGTITQVEQNTAGVTTLTGGLETVTGQASSLAEADTLFEGALNELIGRLNAIEEKHVTMAVRDLSLAFADENPDAAGIQVTQNIALPLTDEYESSIVWSSSDASIVGADGIVTRPTYSEGNATATLNATITYGNQTGLKEFTIEVLALAISDVEKLERDIPFLSMDSFDEDTVTAGIQVTQSMALPWMVGVYESSVTWASDNEAYVASDGTVTRPLFGEADVVVNLTATITNGLASDTRVFSVTILAATE